MLEGCHIMFSPICAITTISHTARMPMPNRHVTGRGHHRTPQRPVTHIYSLL